jgi:hypothetical protein
MVDGTTTTATTTSTNMLGLANTLSTTTTQTTPSDMFDLSYEHHNSTSAPTKSSDDETSDSCPVLYNHSSGPDDSDEDFIIPSIKTAKIRLPSGKTITKKANSPHTSKHRHRGSASPALLNPYDSRRLRGNCAMIPDLATCKTSTLVQKTRRPPTPPTSDSDSESDHSTVLSQYQPSHNSLISRIRLPTQRTTIRSSDAQMLATLPACTQRTLLATTRKAVERAEREEQEYRRKLDGHGNLKSKERFVNDVPGGKSHKNRFMAQ